MALNYAQQYYLEHREQLREYQRNYYKKNKEKLKGAARSYYKKNKEKCETLTAAWKYANPDRVALHSKRSYYKRCALAAAQRKDFSEVVRYTQLYDQAGAILGI